MDQSNLRRPSRRKRWDQRLKYIFSDSSNVFVAMNQSCQNFFLPGEGHQMIVTHFLGWLYEQEITDMCVSLEGSQQNFKRSCRLQKIIWREWMRTSMKLVDSKSAMWCERIAMRLVEKFRRNTLSSADWKILSITLCNKKVAFFVSVRLV